jgi:hypothetical protein
MSGDRICLLTAHYRKIRVDWRTSKSPMARELQGLMSETIIINPEDNLIGKTIPLSETQLIRFEETIKAEQKYYN